MPRPSYPVTTTREVTQMWAAGQAARNKNNTLTSDGVSLRSYDLLIGQISSDGVRRVWEFRGSLGVSSTTSTHVGYAMCFAGKLEQPDLSEVSFHRERSSGAPRGCDDRVSVLLKQCQPSLFPDLEYIPAITDGGKNFCPPQEIPGVLAISRLDPATVGGMPHKIESGGQDGV